MASTKSGVKKVVLAYSGGLDTSVIIRWLIENYGCEVVAFAADLGQGENLKPLRAKALKTGAGKVVIKDLKEEFVRDFIVPAIQANAVYEGKYTLATALGRPLIAKWLVQIALAEKADAIAHGCTGKGNDQVRFEVVAHCLAPRLRVLAPVREWELKTRDDEIEYARKWKIPVTATKDKPYSLDTNLYGTSIECGVLEDPWTEPPDDAYQELVSPEKAPNRPQIIEVGFTRGVPSHLNGKATRPLKIIQELKRIGGRHGVGRVDLVENRLVGIKSREIYEAPAATILLAAHRELEAICLDRETLHFKETVGPKIAELVYNGLWFTPLRRALSTFVSATQETVTGTVRMKLFKGQCIPLGRKSPHSMYDYRLATYDADDAYDHSAAEGFINIYGLPYKVAARVQKRKKR